MNTQIKGMHAFFPCIEHNLCIQTDYNALDKHVSGSYCFSYPTWYFALQWEKGVATAIYNLP